MTDRAFTLSSGRKMGVTTSGNPLSRRVVVFCHPMPGAGDFDPNPLVTHDREIRLLAFDRPGYGGSEPLREGESTQVQARADDVAEFLTSPQMQEELVGQAHFGVVGWGFGGAVALSLAARHASLFDHAAAVGTSWLSLENAQNQHVASLVGVPPEPGPISFGWDSLGIDTDDPALGVPGAQDRLDHMLAEAATQGTIGMETDLAAVQDLSWAKELRGITASTVLTYGSDDRFTDAASGKWLKRRTRNVRIARVPGARGLTVISVWQRILDHVAPGGTA